METILFTKNDLTSGVEIPADIYEMLYFIANWNDELELAIWFDDTSVYVYQQKYCLWGLLEANTFASDLKTAGIVVDYCPFMFTCEKICCSSCDYEEYVTALCIGRAYIK